MLRNPCVLGGPQKGGTKSELATPALSGAQKRAQVLRNLRILGGPQTTGPQSKVKTYTEGNNDAPGISNYGSLVQPDAEIVALCAHCTTCAPWITFTTLFHQICSLELNKQDCSINSLGTIGVRVNTLRTIIQMPFTTCWRSVLLTAQCTYINLLPNLLPNIILRGILNGILKETKSELATPRLPSRGPKRGCKCYLNPCVLGGPQQRGQNQKSKPTLGATMMPLVSQSMVVQPDTQIVALR